MADTVTNRSDDEVMLMTRVSWMYYMQGMTHEHIASLLGFSRAKVARLVAKAKDAGIVEISINSDYSACVPLEEELRTKGKLKRAIVVPDGDDYESTSASVGRAAAMYLNESLVKGDVLGLGWGFSFKNIIPYIKERKELELETVQLMGSASDTGDGRNFIFEMTAKLGAEGEMKPLPLFVESQEIKETFLKDRTVASIMNETSKCSKALLAISAVDKDNCTMHNIGLINDGEFEDLLKEHSPEAEIASWFIDRNGEVIDCDICRRNMSSDTGAIKAIPEKILEAAGVHKKKAVAAAVRGGWTDVLIVDEELAKAVIEELQCFH